MTRVIRFGLAAAVAIAALVMAPGSRSFGQTEVSPVNGLPNPYETHRNWAPLPGGRPWGSTDGKVMFFVPPHMTETPEGASGEGIAVAADGTIYGAEVSVRGLTKYVKRLPTPY